MEKPNIWLMGDSIVQGYTREEFIGGWGEYLGWYLNSEKFNIENRGMGGRSARYYLNEGRFDAFKDSIKHGDFVFMEFCHNDDATKDYKTMPHRLTVLGEPDNEGRYPVIEGKKVSSRYMPYEFFEAMVKDGESTKEEKEEVFAKAADGFSLFGEEYYPYSSDGSMGTYKWFIKYFCDEVKIKGGVPVIVTAPPRTAFENGKIADGAGRHGGNSFAYIRAARQIAEEEGVALVDLFEKSRELFEKTGEHNTKLYNSFKEGKMTGKWPEDFDKAAYKEGNIFEDTHFNKYGAFTLAGIVAKELLRLCQSDNRLKLFKGNVYETPCFSVACPKGLKNK